MPFHYFLAQYGAYLIFGLLALGVILFLFFFSKRAVVRRKLRSVPEKLMPEVSDGEVVRISGNIVFAGKTLDAPFSGRKCVFYHVSIHTQGRYRRTLAEEEVCGDVVIRAGNYYAVIDTSLVKSYLLSDWQYNSGLFNDATPELEAYLAKRGESSKDFTDVNRKLLYYEGVLEENEKISVAGKATWIKTGKSGLDLPVPQILHIGPENQTPVYLSDDPKVTKEAN